MKKLLFVFALLVPLALSSCGDPQPGKEGGGETKSGEVKKEEKKGDNIELINYENKTIGFTILVPKAGKVLADGKYGFTNSQVLSDGLNEVNVSVNPAVGEVKTIDDFKKQLNNMMAKNITKAEKTKDGMLAVNEQGILVTVYHRVGNVQAKISAPKKLLNIAEKIAMSVKSTK